MPSTPAPPAAPAQSAASSTPAVPATPSPAGAGTSTPALVSPSGPGTSGLSMGSERAAQVAVMESMGFERSQIDLAMRAAFYNSERAIEYLLNGIPESVQEHRNPAPAATPTPSRPSPIARETEADDVPGNLFDLAAAAGRGGAASGGAAGGGSGRELRNLLGAAGAGAGAPAGGLGNLDFLRNNPQFQQLRQVVQQNPQMLEPILQQVGAGNPQLATLISEHPDQFLQLLSEDAENDAPLPPGAQAIQVTAEEREAIERASTK